jgi:hypothetical protein
MYICLFFNVSAMKNATTAILEQTVIKNARQHARIVIKLQDNVTEDVSLDGRE